MSLGRHFLFGKPDSEGWRSTTSLREKPVENVVQPEVWPSPALLPVAWKELH